MFLFCLALFFVLFYTLLYFGYVLFCFTLFFFVFFSLMFCFLFLHLFPTAVLAIPLASIVFAIIQIHHQNNCISHESISN